MDDIKLLIEKELKKNNFLSKDEILDEGLWSSIKHGLSKLGSLKTWAGKGKKEKQDAIKQLQDEIKELTQDSKEAVVKLQNSLKSKNFPNMKEHSDFITAISEIAYLVDSFEKKSKTSKPEDLIKINQTLMFLRKFTQNALDYQLSDVYKHFNESLLNDAAGPLTGTGSQTINALTSNKFPMFLKILGTMGGVGSYLVNSGEYTGELKKVFTNLTNSNLPNDPEQISSIVKKEVAGSQFIDTNPIDKDDLGAPPPTRGGEIPQKIQIPNALGGDTPSPQIQPDPQPQTTISPPVRNMGGDTSTGGAFTQPSVGNADGTFATPKFSSLLSQGSITGDAQNYANVLQNSPLAKGLPNGMDTPIESFTSTFKTSKDLAPIELRKLARDPLTFSNAWKAKINLLNSQGISNPTLKDVLMMTDKAGKTIVQPEFQLKFDVAASPLLKEQAGVTEQGIAAAISKAIIKMLGIKAAKAGTATLAAGSVAGPVLAGLGLGSAVAGIAVSMIRKKGLKSSRAQILNDLLQKMISISKDIDEKLKNPKVVQNAIGDEDSKSDLDKEWEKVKLTESVRKRFKKFLR